MKKKNKAGVTLIELLLVAAMLGVVSLALYSVLYNGLRVWQRINQPRVSEDVNIFFDKWTSDLKNCLRTANAKFTGDKANLGIPTLVNFGTSGKAPGMVAYLYDEQGKSLTRLQSDYSQLSNGQTGASQVLNNITFLKFEYYYFDETEKAYVWKEECSQMLPLSVKVEAVYDDQTENFNFTRIVDIPISG